MKTEEFNLSEKRDKFYDDKDNCKGLYWENDIKEFLKRLKKDLSKIMLLDGYAGKINREKVSVNLIIDKLAGEELVE